MSGENLDKIIAYELIMFVLVSLRQYFDNNNIARIYSIDLEDERNLKKRYKLDKYILENEYLHSSIKKLEKFLGIQLIDNPDINEFEKFGEKYEYKILKLPLILKNKKSLEKSIDNLASNFKVDPLGVLHNINFLLDDHWIAGMRLDTTKVPRTFRYVVTLGTLAEYINSTLQTST